MGWYDVPRPIVPDLIVQHGRNQARKPALLEGTRRLDWAEFDAATNRVANGLLQLDLGPGRRLAVLMSNSIEMALTLFGAGKAGVSVVPLNTSVPDAAVANMIRDSGAEGVAASGEHCRRIDALVANGEIARDLARIGVAAPAGAGWLDFEAWHAAAPATGPNVVVTPETECNIIYSSGTTGLPKGIVHTHGCRMLWATDLAIALRYHSGAVTVCSLGLYSNISWVAMFCTVLAGGTIVVMPSFSAEALADTIARFRVSHGGFVPVQLQRLMELDDVDRRDFSSLQAIMCCGSPLPPALKRRTRDTLGCELIELYGLTEGIVTTLAPEDFDRKLESVGKPIPCQQLTLVRDDDREAGPGEFGEICGFGRLVMEGYHNRPEATAEATWTDPQGRRWLRTGDIGRIDDEGFLYIVDRKKDMILSGSQNVYPVDIEMVMLQHASVREVAVVGIPSERWGETPLAVVVPAGTVDAADLVAWTNARVGKQQRLVGAVFVDELPRNPNGKILKRELRKLYAGMGDGARWTT
ncbi:MAG TPA: class I adenylate-forming enzyme family protein [Steroidobacteraceae bacterium]|nr:class I adenylate-forming enzyme family protein [Steroidobacteraceae bacterium]